VCPDQAEKPSSQVAINRAILIGVLALSGLLYACAKSPSANVRETPRIRRPCNFYTVAEETAKRARASGGLIVRTGGKHPQFASGGPVSQVLADVGDTVKEEQALIVLDPQELQFEVDRQRGLVHQVRAQLGVGRMIRRRRIRRRSRPCSARKPTCSMPTISTVARSKCSRTT